MVAHATKKALEGTDDSFDVSKARLVGIGPRRPGRLSLRSLREAHGKTQAQVARASGLTQPEISKLETAESLDDRQVLTVRRYLQALGDDLELVATSKLGHRIGIAPPARILTETEAKATPRADPSDESVRYEARRRGAMLVWSELRDAKLSGEVAIIAEAMLHAAKEDPELLARMSKQAAKDLRTADAKDGGVRACDAPLKKPSEIGPRLRHIAQVVLDAGFIENDRGTLRLSDESAGCILAMLRPLVRKTDLTPTMFAEGFCKRLREKRLDDVSIVALAILETAGWRAKDAHNALTIGF
jgi:transcriptional regulator with XRE-family HTH domain